MHTAPGARGTVIGDRYRVAGALRRTGLIDAIDLEAAQHDAGCRIVGVPGDAERVDQWEDAWRAAQVPARLPRLREIVSDEDGAQWAILDPAPAGVAPLPANARAQALRLGEALAAAGLDVGDVTPGMLVVDDDGALAIDGPVWLGGDLPPRTAGRVLADLLPGSGDAVAEERSEQGSRTERRRAVGRPRRGRRVLLPLGIVLALVVAAAILLLPPRSSGVAVVEPAAPGAGDVLLAAASQPLFDPARIDAPVRRRPRRPARPERIVGSAAAGATQAAVAPTPVDQPPALPAATPVPELPPAAAVPELPSAAPAALPVDVSG